ncbi:MAG: hypothetical protein LW807_04815 [Proteobacteria bacterium]|jgi:hypothetical protein|nr:hypothetical protein [Pseudomonadota bacterium]
MSNLIIRNDLELKSGLSWIRQAFILFRERPLHFLFLEILNTAFMFLPFISAFVTPLFTAKFMYLAGKTKKVESFSINEIFKIFNNSFVTRLAFLNFCLSTILLILQFLIESKYPNLSASGYSLTLLLTIPTLILGVAMWLSPAICLNYETPPKIAMLLSIKASFKNILPLLIYSVVIASISLVIMIPLGAFFIWLWSVSHSVILITPFAIIAYLICVIWFSILNISTYFAYITIFRQ